MASSNRLNWSDKEGRSITAQWQCFQLHCFGILYKWLCYTSIHPYKPRPFIFSSVKYSCFELNNFIISITDTSKYENIKEFNYLQTWFDSVFLLRYWMWYRLVIIKNNVVLAWAGSSHFLVNSSFAWARNALTAHIKFKKFNKCYIQVTNYCLL